MRTEQQRRYVINNREKIREYEKRHYAENAERYITHNHKYRSTHKEELAQSRIQRHIKDPRKNLFFNVRNRAKKNNIEFTITLDDIVIPEVCPILKTPFTFGGGHKTKRSTASLDRINPKKGYIPGNVQVISYKANVMKQDATSDELILFSEWINETFGDQIAN